MHSEHTYYVEVGTTQVQLYMQKVLLYSLGFLQLHLALAPSSSQQGSQYCLGKVSNCHKSVVTPRLLAAGNNGRLTSLFMSYYPQYYIQKYGTAVQHSEGGGGDFDVICSNKI